MKSKAAVFWPLVSLLVLADCTTKQVAAERLEPEHVPHEVLGDVVRFTLAYNPGASFSVSLGEHSRWILAALAFGVLGVLMGQYRRAAPHDRMLALALGFVVAGACGNLLDRLRRPLWQATRRSIRRRARILHRLRRAARDAGVAASARRLVDSQLSQRRRAKRRGRRFPRWRRSADDARRLGPRCNRDAGRGGRGESQGGARCVATRSA